MRRLIIGAMALATGALGALGVGLGVRRLRGRHDDVLLLDPVPPLSAGAPAAEAEVASIEADFGAVEVASSAPKRRRPRRRKPAASEAGAGTESTAGAASAAGGSPGAAASAASEAGEAAAPKRRRPRRKPAATGPTEGAEAPDAS